MPRITLFLIILLPLISSGQFNQKKTYNIKKIDKTLKIDGRLNDDVWQDLTKATGFTQISPRNGEKERANQKTEVKICYDDKNIYFGVRMYDNSPDSILKELSLRDEENKNFDMFSIFINPFNDGQMEYNFAITAAGVQVDRKFSESGIDKTWDAVWQSSININNEGWIAEIAIPFSQIRFPDNNSSWAINMARQIRRYREDYSWNPINVKYKDFALQAGLLDGIKNINSPIRLSLMPYASFYAERYQNKTQFPYNYGLDLKYGITESFTLDMTLIPDFGQVDSDAMVLNLSPFEIKYDEKRQFFNEGTELFNKGNDMYYSRRIQDDMINASKVTGRTKNGLAIASLNAITNKTENEPLTNYNITIVDQTFGNSSSISIMNTHMVQQGKFKDANVTGLFARVNNESNTRTYNGKLKMSQEFEGENIKKGYSGELSIGKNNGKYQYSLYTGFKDENYNPNDIGFLSSNNEINQTLSLSYHQFKENKNLIKSEVFLNTNRKTLFTDQKFVDLEIELESKFTLKNYTTIFASLDINPFEKIDYYESRSNNLLRPVNRSKSIRTRSWISTDYRKKIAIDFSFGYSNSPLYNGYGYHWRVSPRYRFNDKISVKYVLSTRNKFNDIGFVTHDSVSLNNINYIFAIRNTNMITNVFTANYIYNNKIDLSVKLRYHLDQVKSKSFKKLDNNGYLIESQYFGIHDINYTTWTSDIAFNWRFAPGSQLSLVWKDAIDNEVNYLTYHLIENLENSFNLNKQSSISLKIIYYLDYLYLQNDKSK